jgi:hypothetical protein
MWVGQLSGEVRDILFHAYTAGTYIEHTCPCAVVQLVMPTLRTLTHLIIKCLCHESNMLEFTDRILVRTGIGGGDFWHSLLNLLSNLHPFISCMLISSLTQIERICTLR